MSGMGVTEKIQFCNQIVWDKGSTPGMRSELMLEYPTATEHCLFFKLGEQFIGNLNADQYWEGWEEIRGYLAEEAEAAGLTPAMLKEITGVGMYSHWFTKSQWTLIPEKYYLALQAAFQGRFKKSYRELRAIHRDKKGGFKEIIGGKLTGMRSYFDNAHDSMTDVWQFPRVVGEERHGHATPKPVAMMERAIKSSCPPGGVLVEPFGGSGSTLMGAETSGRVCHAMEIFPRYCDVIVKRWENFTGQKAERVKGAMTASV